MRKWAWYATLLSLLAVATSATARAANSLTLSGASGAPGANVTLDVSLSLGTGTAPAALQWDLTYSTSDLSLVTGTYHSVGSGSAAGKAADCNLISAGDVRCILSGINTTTIGSGAVASLTFQIAGGTTDTSTQVSMANVVAANVNANSLGVTDSGAIVTINQPLDCTYSLSANSSSIGSSAGSSSFNVVAPTGCAWSVTNDSTFITITDGSSGSGNGTVAYSFTANSGAGRSGDVNDRDTDLHVRPGWTYFLRVGVLSDDALPDRGHPGQQRFQRSLWSAVHSRRQPRAVSRFSPAPVAFLGRRRPTR